MDTIAYTNQIVSDVMPGSPAEKAGLVRGDVLLSINGEPVRDVVDYEFLTAEKSLRLVLGDASGKERRVSIRKEDYEPLGLNFASGIMSPMRTCRNHCLFCFIDQMAPGGRTSLHVKDDDWRMSFIMGNYVSLTNVDDEELDRIIRRRVSPLYVSLHASRPESRVLLMRNPQAGRIMEQLGKIRDAGLKFHLQVVLCPGINDGAVLEQTLSDVETLRPAAQSLAIVPVGLTRFREKLYPLRCFTGEEAGALITQIARKQAAYRKKYGTRLVFLSDEWYCIAGQPLPPYEAYEEFDQIENGVGLLRLFEQDFLDALEQGTPRREKRVFDMAGGRSATPFFLPLWERLSPYNVEIHATAVPNRFFGEQVTVAGLITGQDLIGKMENNKTSDTLLIPRSMLRENDNVFLDNLTVLDVEKALNMRVLPFSDGEELARILLTE